MNVEILMSTYNGMHYVKRQIESILNQDCENIHLTIRDDGSTDDTVKIIENLKKIHLDKIDLYYGHNLGYRKSFLQLLKLARKADYYGFADQDDIWDSGKISRAIDCLNSEKNPIKLYACGLNIVDENMNIIGQNDISQMPNNIESYFTRSRLAGCTFVFSQKCKEIAENFADLDLCKERMPDHDFVVGACAFSSGKVYLDEEKFIYHIRHSKSVTSGGNGLKKRIQTEWNIVFRRKGIRSTMALELLNTCNDFLNNDAKKFFSDVVVYKRSWKDRLKLLTNKKMKTGMFLCDLEQKIKILIGTY